MHHSTQIPARLILRIVLLLFLPTCTAAVAPAAPEPAGLPAFVVLRPTVRVNVDSGASRAPIAAVKLSGSAVAVAWGKPRGARGESGFLGSDLIVRLVDPEGKPRGPEVAVAGGSDEVALFPALAVLGPDRMVAVWRSIAREGQTSIRARLLNGKGSPIGPLLEVTAQDSGDPGPPAVAADSHGGFAVAWAAERQDLRRRALFFRRFAMSGEPPGEASFLCDACPANGAPALVAAGDGSLFALWVSGENGQGPLRGRRLGPGGAGPEVTIDTPELGERLLQPTIVATSSGGFAAAWRAKRNDHTALLVGRMDLSGHLLAPPRRVRNSISGAVSPPALASDMAGDLLVVWSEEVGGTPQLRAQALDAAAGLPTFRIITLGASASTATERPALVALGGDSFLAAWWDGEALVRRVTLDRGGGQPHTAAQVACDRRQLAAILGRLRLGPESKKGDSLVLFRDFRGFEVRAAVTTDKDLAAAVPWRAYSLTLTGGVPALTEEATGDSAAPRVEVVPFRDLAPPPAPTAPSSRSPVEPMLAPCDSQVSPRDSLVFQRLARQLRVSGAASSSFLTALYRGEGIDTFLLAVYPLSPRGEAQGSLAARVELGAANDEESPPVALRRLRDCAPEVAAPCTQVSVPIELQWRRPTAQDGGSADPQQAAQSP